MFARFPRAFAALSAAAAAVLAASPSLAGSVPALTATTLTSSLNPVAQSQTTQLSATVTVTPIVACPGVVTIKTSGGTVLCGDLLLDPQGGTGVATCNLTGSAIGPVGAQSLFASYVPSIGNCWNSTSAGTMVTVAADPTAVPTVGEWTLWGLMGLMMMGGAALLVRRTRGLSGPQL